MEHARQVWLEALEYHRRGWSIIPLKHGTKKSAVQWKRFSQQQPSESQIHEWFDRDQELGIAVILGMISGGLVVRDFDDRAVYETWKEKHPQLAKALPTVATSRGCHVYARSSSEAISAVREQIGRPGASGAILVAGGELRCGDGCYVVCPPSIHESGHVYRWQIPLPDGPLPTVELIESGFYQPEDEKHSFPKLNRTQRDRRGDGSGFPPAPPQGGRESPNPTHPASPAREPCNREHRENGEHRGRRRIRKRTDEIEGESIKTKQNLAPKKSENHNPTLQNLAPSKSGGDWSIEAQQAIADSLPVGPGKRHRQVFDLARGLKALPEFADAAAENLKPYVQRWHQMALDQIQTKPFEETWIDFLKAWPRVKHPKGEDAMTKIFEASLQNELPPVAENYEQHPLKILVGLCRELQRATGEGPFYLACRTAARLLGVDHTTANRWLFLLVADGVLEEVEKGNRAQRRATRFRYLAE